MAITKEQVFAVADEMFADGTAPTLIGVRKELGSGSYSTISGFLAEWKASTRAGDKVPDVEVPEDVVQAFDPALKRLWSLACDQARELAETARQEAAEKVAAAEASKAEALDALQSVQAESDSMIAHAQKLAGQLAAEQNCSETLRRQVQATQAALDESRSSYAELVASLEKRGAELLKASQVAKPVQAVKANPVKVATKRK